MERLIDQLLEEISPIRHQAGSETTQVSNTIGSYRKAAELLSKHIPLDGIVLDYGSGLGLGTEQLREVFGPNVTVESYEPNPRRSKVPPTFASSDEINKEYDGIVCLNVLNVLEPDLRDEVVEHILTLLDNKGSAVIGVRKWTGDVSLAKHSTPVKGEDHAVWIKKSGGSKVYQRGFDGDELLSYISMMAPSQFVVRRITGITNNAVLVQKKK